MASTVIDPTAALIAGFITNLAVTPTVKSYQRDPGMAGLDSLPAGVVGLPSLERTGVDEAEGQLGHDDWLLSYPVEFYFDIGDAVYTATQAVEVLEAFVKVIDANRGLGQDVATILDAKVVSSEPVEVVDTPRPMLVYSCRLEVLRLVQPS